MPELHKTIVCSRSVALPGLLTATEFTVMQWFRLLPKRKTPRHLPGVCAFKECDRNQAASATTFRLRHQPNKLIPAKPEAKSGNAAGSGACDTCAVKSACIVTPGFGPIENPFTTNCHTLLPSLYENVVPSMIVRVSE